MADATVVAGSASLVDAGENGDTSDGEHAIVKILRQRVLEIDFNAGHLHRRKKLSIGQLRQSFGLSADARKLFHVVVPRRDVGVANRPVDSDSFSQVGFKIEIAPAVTLAAPKDGLSADLASANPGKMFSGIRGIRIVLVADKKLMRVFIACVVNLALNGLSGLTLGAIVPAAVLEFPDGNVLDIIAFGDDAAARFEDQCVQALFGEFLGGPAAGDPRANNDGIVSCGRHVRPYPSASPAPGAA